MDWGGDRYVDVGIVEPVGLLARSAQDLAERGAIRLNCGGGACRGPDGTRWGPDRFFGFGLTRALPRVLSAA